MKSIADSHCPALPLVIVTTFFPNVTDPHRTPFLRNLVKAMKSIVDVDVLAPIAIAPVWLSGNRWARLHGIPSQECIDGIQVQHPRILVVPKMGWLSGVGFFLGIWRQLLLRKRSGNKFLVHAHCGYPDAVGVALACGLMRLPYVVTVHGSDINVLSEKVMLRPQIRWALKHAKGIVAVSMALKLKVAQLLDKTHVQTVCIPCAGYDPGLFFLRDKKTVRDSLGISTESRVVVFVGHLVFVKAVDVLIEAWAVRMKNEVNQSDLLVLVGAGECLSELEAGIARMRIGDSVRFTGAISQVEVSSWLAAADVLCLPSRNEGMPNVVVEALASGVPVVASRVGGIPELIEDGKNGLLVQLNQPIELARTLDRALEREWSREALCHSVSHLTWTSLATRNLEFIRSLIKE